MRILMLNRYGSTKGGAESYLRALCDALGGRGHTVALASHLDRDESWPAVRDGFRLAATTSLSAEPSAAERAEVERIVAAFRPDVAHVHNVEATWLPSLLAAGVPTVFAIHDHRVSCPTGTRYWTAWKRVCGIQPGPVCLGYNAVAHCGSYRANATLRPYRSWRAWRASASRVARLQVFSEYMASTLRLAGLPHDRIAVTPYPAPPMPAPATLDLRTAGRPVIFASGRLVKEKGFDLLLDALAHVTTPVVCAIAGSGHHGAALIARSASVPRIHDVRFLGWLPAPELVAWIEQAAVVAVPSAWPEPFGIAGLEAMASARPVVATKVGGIGEWLVDGVTGVAVAPGDATAFGSAIQRLLDDDETRTAYGLAGAERAAHVFGIDTHADAVEALYARTREAVSAA